MLILVGNRGALATKYTPCTMYTMAPARKIPKPSDGVLDKTLTIRVTPADEDLLDEVTKDHPLARRGAVAREALRRGLESMQTETKKGR